MSDRLRRYDSTASCGQWNTALIEDFRSDSMFICRTNELFGEVAKQHSNRECITSDGTILVTLKIEIGTSIDLYFQVNFLDAPHGYGIAPAKLSVVADKKRDDYVIATLCCGLREPDGDFWYPQATRLHDVVLPDEYYWAHSDTRVYGPPEISSWIDRQPRQHGEQ